METKRIKSFRTRLNKKSYEEIVGIAVKQYSNIISLRGILDAKTSKIMSLCAKINNYIRRTEDITANIESLKVELENIKKDNALFAVTIDEKDDIIIEKDTTINKLQIAVYSMAIVICGLVGYIIC